LCVCLFSILCAFFWFSLDYFVIALFAFVVLGLVSSVLRQEVGWEEHLRNDLLCVKWDVKPQFVSAENIHIFKKLLKHVDFSYAMFGY